MSNFYNWCALSLRTIQRKKWSIHINKWLSYGQIVFHGRHFVRHLGICYRICVKLLQQMSAIITHNSVNKNEVSISINGWVTANYSVSQPPFYPPSWNLLSDLCQTSTTDVRCHCAQFSKKNEVSILINDWVTAKYSVSRPPFCPPSWNL